MHPRFLGLLKCPETGSNFKLHAQDVDKNGCIIKGELIGSSTRYPIINGIPRFVNIEDYTASFGYEWKKWAKVQFETENTNLLMATHTRRMFESILGNNVNRISGKYIVDFGCGSGRFLEQVRKHGGYAIGLDLSLAVESARDNFRGDPKVLIVQGDLLNPPFKKGVFDGGFSIGVFHHTPDPARGLQKFVKCIYPGGWLACAVYPKGGFYDSISVRRWRKINRICQKIFGVKFALGYAYCSAVFFYPFIQSLAKSGKLRKIADYIRWRYLVVCNIPDFRWRVLDTFDAISPLYASTHTHEEVKGWLSLSGCVEISQSPWSKTAFTAKLPL
jgi:SAM-dependent methyltransferase